MGINLESLQRFVLAGQAAQRAVDRATGLTEHPQRLGAIVGFLGDPHQMLRRLPITTQSTYLHGDRHDAMVTTARLRTCGSIVEAVSLEIAADELRERAAAAAADRAAHPCTCGRDAKGGPYPRVHSPTCAYVQPRGAGR